jgi:alcohol dehydrogenase (cytochrome c)
MMKNALAASLALAAAAASALGPSLAAQEGRTFVPASDQVLTNPDGADWLHISRTYNQHRYSPLDQINKSNVRQLALKWSRGLPQGVQESTPIVYRGVMYAMVPGGGIQALNATNGDLLWEYRREYAQGVPRLAARSKNLAIYEDMIYLGAPDGYLLAIDAQTGKLRWETKTDNGQITAGGLLVADGKVISNRTCEQGKREFCFIAAHDARTGKELWRFYTTAAPGEPGGDTWGNLPVDQRAAGAWGLPGSYDPVRKVVYWGVANPNPYTRFKRHGGYDEGPPTAPTELYTNSTLALNIETGKLVWYYQELPGDDWDADHNQERLLIRTRVSPDPKHVKWINPGIKPGSEMDVVVTVAEAGGMFAVARDTGQFLWARPFPFDDPNFNLTVADVKTGRTALNPSKMFKKDGDTVLECFHNTRSLWQIAYHPGRNSIYVPFHDQCLSMEAVNKSGTGYGRRVGVPRPGSDPMKFMGVAKVDVATGEMRVIYSQPQPTNGSALATAGDLVFFGDLNRRFRALDAESGKVLWETVVGGMVMNSTISYAVDGKQYVMIYTGGGQSATAGPISVVGPKVMAPPVQGHNAIYVFALP